MKVHVRVPGSTSNLGAGFDFLGLALDLWLEVEARTGGSYVSSYSGTLDSVRPETDLMLNVLRSQGLTDVSLTATSRIPVGRGLGSSAAALTAAFAVVTMLKHGNWDLESLYENVRNAEGHPDNAGPAVLGGLVAAFDGPRKLEIHPSLSVVLAVPEFQNDTAESRRGLPGTVATTAAVRQARKAAALVQGLVQGDADLIRFGMGDEIAAPRRAPLVPGYEEAVTAGQEAGALGVTISGAGPALIAVVRTDQRSDVHDALLGTLNGSSHGWTGIMPDISTTGIRLTTDS